MGAVAVSDGIETSGGGILGESRGDAEPERDAALWESSGAGALLKGTSMLLPRLTVVCSVGFCVQSAVAGV